MTNPYPKYFAEKHSIVRELFIATADDNYITARWCFHENLNVDYFWLAVHCLEKYMKAVLLLNGRSSLGYQHEIFELFKEIHKFANDLLPAVLVRPTDMPKELWQDEAIEDFIGRIYLDGQAHNRYQLFGYIRRPVDLWKLDQVVFVVRRLCQPLDTSVFEQESSPTYRELLIQEPRRWNLQSKLEDTFEGKRGEALKHAFLNRNYSFAPNNYAHSPKMTYNFAAANSILGRRLLESLAQSSNFETTDELWQWVKESVYLPKQVIADVEKERERLKRETLEKEGSRDVS